jgi:preprotein translocase subunit SecF
MRQTPVLDLVGKRGWFYLFSFLILLPGVIALLIPPRLNLGIDFSSGSTFTVRFEQPVTKDELNGALADLDHPEARVQGTGQNEFLVRTKELRGAGRTPPVGPAPVSERDAIEDGLREQFGSMVDAQGVADPAQGFLEFSSISATVSGKLGLQRSWPFICCGITGNSIAAVAAASVAIFLYLWWSFRSVPRSFRFGTAAVLALVHDALLVLGVFSILGKTIGTEINVFFIAALLTVIGFSVHDSIVVFDRIRETVTRGEGRTFAEAVNSSLLQTLSRSLTTSLTLIFAILALLLMGGESIREFLWAMLIGTAVGTYSSICFAAQVLVSWDEGDVPRFFRRLLGRPEPEEEYEAVAAET